MNTNHKPETLLPWFATAQVCKSGMRVLSKVDDEEVARDCQKGDAAYIAHSANAYPRLVAALHVLVQPCPADEYFDAARELLRELGEVRK